MNKILFLLLPLFLQSVSAAEVNIYSARKEALIKPLLDQFTEETGIEINIVTGQADTLLKRLEVEGKNTPADILLTVDVARLVRAKEKGLFQAVDSEILKKSIPEHYRDNDNQWFGLSLRSRVIIYAPDRVKEEDLSSYEDLADSKWKNRVCVRSSSNVYNQSLVAAMVANQGVEKTEAWAKGLVSNFARPPKGGDRDQIKAVAAGVCDVALVNTYYLAGMLASTQKNEVTAAKKIKLFWPDQNGRGAHMNVSGAGLLKPARHKKEAIQLLEYLVSDKAQRWYAETNHEYSINESIESSPVLKSWGKFKADKLNLNLLGKYNTDAVLLMDRAGWK
ncbi:MAG: Fe(3+) ABC transporter substrate-binding protein [Proteobacteria bacterium]|nr:Fe(3+) ABC transporter substrate-binding protein [Pseudomonadota bacterium]NOG61497.1 Fe(3+) ABC transporter substrate-binding protein [Pseudomonadota bacterium]